jgi:FdhE protein
MTARILQPGEIEGSATVIPTLRLPPAGGYFAARAARLRQLAEGHRLGDWLDYLGRLAELQDAALADFPGSAGPAADVIARSREFALPPLAPLGWQRDPAWHATLRAIAGQLRDSGPAPARAVAARLAVADAAWLDGQANRFLAAATDGLDIAATPLLGAALQVYWTRLAADFDPAAATALDVPNLCPLCGSQPVASVVRIGGAEAGLRYLHCSLCETEWHMVRVKCSHCDSTKGISYCQVDGAAGQVRAETCDECHHYLKIVSMERDPGVDPFADDLASLALDLLMDQAGYQRSGFNPLLVAGES